MSYEQCQLGLSVDELKQRFVEVWNSLQQNHIDVAINEWKATENVRACRWTTFYTSVVSACD